MNTSEAGFTKGPWTLVVDVNDHNGWKQPEQLIHITAGDTLIAHYYTSFVEYPDADGENEANGRLMAAAPDLYDAADNALNALIGCCVPSGGVDDRKTILEAQAMLRAAINKATGN